MKKILKIISYSILFLVVLCLLAGFLASRFIDPNKYKDKIAAVVYEKTGRHLVMQGPLEFSFFPWLGVRVQAVQLANAAGFEPTYFAAVGEANIRVKLLPLFSRQIEVGRVTLKNMDIRLAKNKQGVTNWQDMTHTEVADEKTTQTTQITKTTTNKPMLFSIAGVDIQNATLSWVDAQKNQTLQLKNITIKSDMPKMGASFPVQIAFDMQNMRPKITGHVALNSDVLLDQEKIRYALQNLRLTFTPAEKNAQPILFQAARLFADMVAQTGALEKGTLSSGDLHAQFDLQGQHLLDKPVFQGTLHAPIFDLKKTMHLLGKDIVTTDPNALQKVSLETQFSGTDSSIQCNPFVFGIDRSTLQGNVAINDFTMPAIRFNLNLDQLTVDNYLPPKSDQPPISTKAQPMTAAAVDTAEPADTATHASNLSLSGNLHIDSLTFSKTVLNKVSANVSLQNNVLTLNPLKALIYKGSATGSVTMNFMHATPVDTIDGTFSGIDMIELVQSKRLTGKANFATHLTTMGKNKSEIMQHLNGDLRFNVQNGALVGTNIPYQVERAVALFKHQPAPATPDTTAQTNFDLLQGTGTFSAGIFTNDDLLIQSSQFKGTGRGTANLIAETVHYQLRFVGLQRTTDAQGKAAQAERQTPIPILITGTFEKPIVTPDLQALVQSAIEQKAAEKVQEKLGPNAGRAVEGILQLLQK